MEVDALIISETKKPRRKGLVWPKTVYDLILVLWDDASGLNPGWTSKDEEIKMQLAMSCGFLIKENDEHIIIAQDIDDEGSHNGRTQIPKGMVKEIKILKKANKKL